MSDESGQAPRAVDYAQLRPYIACLDLKDRLCVVVGGGAVAVRHVTALLESGARIRVVAAAVVEHLSMLAQAGRIEVLQRPYTGGDLEGAALAFATLDEPEANAAVAHDARSEGVLCHTEGAAASDFAVPALLRHGELTVAVSATGGLEGYARRIRDLIAVSVGPEFGRAAELYSSVQANILAADETRRPSLWDSLFALDLPRVIHDRGFEAARTVLVGWMRRQRFS